MRKIFSVVGLNAIVLSGVLLADDRTAGMPSQNKSAGRKAVFL